MAHASASGASPQVVLTREKGKNEKLRIALVSPPRLQCISEIQLDFREKVCRLFLSFMSASCQRLVRLMHPAWLVLLALTAMLRRRRG